MTRIKTTQPVDEMIPRQVILDWLSTQAAHRRNAMSAALRSAQDLAAAGSPGDAVTMAKSAGESLLIHGWIMSMFNSVKYGDSLRMNPDTGEWDL